MASSLLVRSSFRYLIKHPVLMGLSIIGVALGVAVVIAIDLANTSATEAFRLSAETVTGKATHQITGVRNVLDESLYPVLRIEAGIRDSAPVIEGFAAVPSDPGRTLQVLGIDPFADAPFREFTGGQGFGVDVGAFVSRFPSGMLSATTARELATEAGDTLLVSIEGIDHLIRIVQILETVDEQTRRALDNLLVVDVATAQTLFGMTGYLSRIDLILPDTPAGNQRLADVEALLPEGARLEPSSSRSDTLLQMTRAFSLNLTALSMLALVVGMFLIYNTMTFSVVQRRSIIGRLRAVGVTKRELFGLILGESLLIGILGTAIGLGAGIVLGQSLVHLVTDSINDLYYVVRVRSFNVSGWTLTKGIFLGIGATLLAAWAPAREAASATASTVLRRSEEESNIRKMIPGLTVAACVMAIFAVALLLLPGQSIVLSYLALLLIILSFATLTPGAVLITIRLVRPIMGRMGGVIGRMAAQGAVTTLSRTAVAIASLMIAISATIGVGVMVGSFRSTVEVWLEYTLQADVYVSPPGTVFRRNDATMSPAVEAILRSDDGVESAFSVRTAKVEANGSTTDLIVIDPGPRKQSAYRFQSGDPAAVWERFDVEDVVMVSEPYAFRNKTKPGELVSIQTDTGLRSFEVGAVYYDYGSDLGSIMMSRSIYRVHFEDRGVSGLALYAEPGVDVDELVSRLREKLEGQQQVMMRSNRGLREASLEVFDRTFTVTIVLRLLAVMVAFIGVLSALMALQLERARELAVMRANGLTPGQVWRYVTTQTGLMGLMAGIFSAPLGFILAYVLINIINRRSFGWTLQMDLSPSIFIQAVLLALAAALLAGLYPAWKMSRANPANALRDE